MAFNPLFECQAILTARHLTIDRDKGMSDIYCIFIVFIWQEYRQFFSLKNAIPQWGVEL